MDASKQLSLSTGCDPSGAELIHPSLHPSIQYSLSTYYVLNSLLSIKDTAEIKKKKRHPNKISCSWGANITVGRQAIHTREWKCCAEK